MSYRLELAKTARSGCSNTECKTNNEKIPKGTLRHGVMVTIKEHQTWKWRHWGCVTPRLISNMKETINDDFDYLDGYDELPDDLQETVRKAFEQGHVDDEDWRGVPYFRIMEENLVTDVLQDVEQNRTGASRSFRSPAAKKKKKAEGEPDAEAGNDGESPSKPASKKRGRAKKQDAAEDAEAPESPTKKAKTADKKGKKTKDDENSEPAPYVKPVKATKAAKKSKTAQNADGPADSDEAPPPKKARGRKKATKEEVLEETDSKQEADSDHDVLPPAKKSRTSKNAAAAKVARLEHDSALSDEEAKEVQKPKKSRKKAAKQIANGEEADITQKQATNGVGRKGGRSKKG